MSEGESPVNFWVGTYTSPSPGVPDARGKGILRGSLDPETGQIDLSVTAPSAENPSYLAVTCDRLFAVAENPDQEGALLIYRKHPDGSLEWEGSYPSGANHPCHLTVVGSTVAVANYGGDRLQLFEPTKGGWRRREGHPYQGTGPVSERQEAPHPHQAVHLADWNQLAVCDLGSDRIWWHDIGEEGIDPSPAGYLSVPPGTGPRHLAYASESQFLYVLGELSGEILSYRRDHGEWRFKGVHRTVTGESTPSGAAIKLHPNSRALYASERSTSRIFVFSLAPETGVLATAGSVATEGRGPRDFGIDPSGRWLIALYQDSHTIATIPLNPNTGLPTGSRGRAFSCQSPVCWVPDT